MGCIVVTGIAILILLCSNQLQCKAAGLQLDLQSRNRSLTWYHNALHHLDKGERGGAEMCLRKVLEIDPDNKPALEMLNRVSLAAREYREAAAAGQVKPRQDFIEAGRPGVVRDVHTDGKLVLDRSIDWNRPVTARSHSDFDYVAWNLSGILLGGQVPGSIRISFFPWELMVRQKDDTTLFYLGMTVPYVEAGDIAHAVILTEGQTMANMTVTFFNELGNVVCPNPDRVLNEAASFAMQEIARQYLEIHAPGFSEAYVHAPSFHEDNFNKTEWMAWHLAEWLRAWYGSYEETYETLADVVKYEKRRNVVDEAVEELEMEFEKHVNYHMEMTLLEMTEALSNLWSK